MSAEVRRIGQMPVHEYVDHEYIGFMRSVPGVCCATVTYPNESGAYGCHLPREHPVHEYRRCEACWGGDHKATHYPDVDRCRVDDCDCDASIY